MKGLNKKKLILTFAITFFWVLLFLPFQFPGNKVLWDRISDAGHLPFFAMFAIFNFHFLSKRISRSYLATFLITGGVAAFAELIQPITGRTASISDLINGILGGALGALLCYGYYERKIRKSFWISYLIFGLLALVFVLSPVWKQLQAMSYQKRLFPMLADFEDNTELRLWVKEEPLRKGRVTLSLSSEQKRSGVNSLEVNISPGNYAGISYRAERQDWRGFQKLNFFVFNPGEPFLLHLRIDDFHNCDRFEDRFNKQVLLPSGWTEIELSLPEIEAGPAKRILDLSQIRRMMFFVGKEESTRVFFLDAMQLM